MRRPLGVGHCAKAIGVSAKAIGFRASYFVRKESSNPTGPYVAALIPTGAGPEGRPFSAGGVRGTYN